MKYKKTCILNKLTTKPQAYARVCNENKEKEETTALNFLYSKRSSLNSGFQKLIEMDQDQTSSIKASYNKGIHTIVKT